MEADWHDGAARLEHVTARLREEEAACTAAYERVRHLEARTVAAEDAAARLQSSNEQLVHQCVSHFRSRACQGMRLTAVACRLERKAESAQADGARWRAELERARAESMDAKMKVWRDCALLTSLVAPPRC